MDPAPRRTSRGGARRVLSDGSRGKKIYLIKMVPLMRLTYQVHGLAEAAERERRKLIIMLPRGSALSPDLQSFVATRRRIKIKHVKVS